MSLSDEAKEWWTQTLLNQTKSAHPVFGRDIDVQVEGDVVILNGKVQSPDEAEQIEREARSIDFVHTVVNHLTVERRDDEEYHMQTVVAVMPTKDEALLASKAVQVAKVRSQDEPQLFESEQEARSFLRERAAAAEVPEESIERFVNGLGDGKILLADRVTEDDAVRVVSALEGTKAESLETLPPEPEAVCPS